MILIESTVITGAAIIATYLTINGTSSDKRLLNAILAMILNAVGALGALNTDIIKEVDNSVEVYTYSDTTLAILHVILALVCFIIVISGAYDKIGDVAKDTKKNL
jgi:hypothetical protein